MDLPKRSHALDRLARLHDSEILPLWTERFGRLLLRQLAAPPRAMVLDVGTGTGFTALDALRRLDPGGRVVAIDRASVMLDVARDKAGDLAGKRVFFRTLSAEPKLPFADEVFDAVLCNLALAEMADRAQALREFTRVTRPGGRVAVSLPLEGTFAEFHEVLRQALVDLSLPGGLARLDAHLKAQPTTADLRALLDRAGLTELLVEDEEYRLRFRTSHDFFFAPVIELGPLPAWKAIAGGPGAGAEAEMQAVFWRAREILDERLARGPFAVTVRAGSVWGTRPGPGHVAPAARPSRPPPLPARPGRAAAGFELELFTPDLQPLEVTALRSQNLDEADTDLGGALGSRQHPWPPLLDKDPADSNPG